ncbi:metal ABC transporter ATP-binding protein [Clostridium sp. BJN0001]|uniref:metal ABC transporter ATP-binding protein n=1 Tax=Clostridium sp. BJN0001 TaxID=2930219 RepID=UPI001FD0AE2A|nr:metal ABC transporter ATP-binding protein [Clostridium sp. BJN0001]
MIKIENLSFSYCKGQRLLNNININIPDGVYLSFLGENGSCKSTIIKLILGILKPDFGKITVNTKKIAYVAQRLDNFNTEFPITVNELLKCHAKIFHIKSEKVIDDALKKVSMTEFKNNLIGKLSGGQMQRVFIAKALIGDPELILLDEPSTGVDEKNQKEMYKILQTLNKKYKKTIISVEHNKKIALKYSTHILTIKNSVLSLYKKDDYEKMLKGDSLC